MKKSYRRFFVLSIAIFMLFTSSFIASADGFKSYAYNSKEEVVEVPEAVSPYLTLTGTTVGVGNFKAPQDLIVTGSDEIYVADTGNNRIVVIGSNGSLIKEIKTFANGEKSETFNVPKGIFVTENKEIYVCDTENYRIVHLDATGNLVRIITLESGESLPSDFLFKPTKVAVDSSGRIFATSEGFTSGLLEFTAAGEYIRYMGAPKVSLSVSELFWRTFSTKEQRKRSASNVSVDYNNVEIDEQGFLMVTSTAFTYWEYASGKAQPIRRLNAKGSDVLSRVGNPSGDLIYTDSKTSRATYKGPSTLVDICTMKYGSYGVLDQNRGRVFVYNSDGEFLYEFAGPADVRGGIATATALDYNDYKFYTLDSEKNQINIYTVTSYGKLFESVYKASKELDYAKEEELWNSIISENVNCELAMRGLGTAAYRRQDMTTAMEYFEMADDTEGYSKAYVFVRRQWIEKNAIWMILGVIATVALLIFLNKKWKKFIDKKGRESYFTKLNFSKYVIFHPIRGFWELKREKRGSVAAAATFVALACGVQILSSVATGFLFNSTDIQDYSIFSDIFFILAAVVLWSVTQWCVTVLMEGEGNFKEIFTATGYALVPYVFLNFVAILFSRVLSLEEAELHAVIVAIGLVYTVFLMFISVMSTHDYTFGKTVLVIVIILVVIILIIFIVVLLLTLTQQMVTFVNDLYNEISLRI